MTTPLDGTLVLDLTRHLPGPFCGQLLADFGATVVKVEDKTGDPVRFIPPFDEHEVAIGFRSLNSGKKSIALDLKKPEGRDILLRLMARADVLLDGFRPGVLERLGAGYSKERFPKLVYCAMSGYGSEGPYRDRAGHDLNYECFAGAVSSTNPTIQVGDMGAALAAFSGVLLALLARGKTGAGQRVETSMLQAAVALQPFQLVPPARGEKAMAALTLAGTVPCYRVYRTKDDRHVALAALEPKFWESFCEVVDRPDWVARQMDPGFIPELEAFFATRPLIEWRLLEDSECCLSAALSWDEAAQDPQVEALGLIVKDATGKAARVAPPVTLTDTKAQLATDAAPRPGHHTDEVLRELLGLDDTTLRTLRASGAIH
jgi:crotonobetainyl-CoA:carnitine CoA-transferase CaiB-like acyl-CoA transferase